jgi:hypothetical protein
MTRAVRFDEPWINDVRRLRSARRSGRVKEKHSPSGSRRRSTAPRLRFPLEKAKNRTSGTESLQSAGERHECECNDDGADWLKPAVHLILYTSFNLGSASIAYQ